MVRRWLVNPKSILFTPILLALVLAVACGAAATATPQPAPAPASGPAPTLRPPPPQQLAGTPAQPAAVATATPVAKPTPIAPPVRVQPRVTRLRYAIGDVDNETNRTWAGSRQAYVQYDPMLENLIGIHPETGQYVPELAERWDIGPDMKEWTFYLRKNVPFHKGWGKFTAKDVKHTVEILNRPDSRLSTRRYFTGPKREIPVDKVVEIVDDHTVRFHLPQTTSIMRFIVGNDSNEMAIWSKAFWDAEGEKGLDEKGLVGTNAYQYLGRRPGQSIIMEKAPQPHWAGKNPDFQELEVLWVIEDAARYAALRAGEVQVVDLPLDLQKDAEKRGFKLVRSRFTANNLFVFFGGMWFSDNPKDKEKFDATVPWVDKRVRKAMNKAINREELLAQLYKGIGELMYVGNYHPSLEGWDPTWPKRYKEAYGYDPGEAKRLLKEAGYGPAEPKGPVKVTALSYVSPGESELPQVMEAVSIYWQQVGIEVKIQPMDGAEAAKRWRTRATAHQVWPNIVIYFPVEYWVLINNTSNGATNAFSNNFLDQSIPKWQNTTDPAKRDQIAREVGNHMFEEYVDLPLFWFPHTVVVDPKVVADWVYPGNAVPRLSHPHLAKAAK